ncbi:ABC transporter ATP-binding protein [Roseivirga sp.]|uniref:ABC transporter ATP-binding protein n=1 Tax=Roseivirga sp. TaxID=1964215 RepID=UPI003BA9F936
MGGVLTITMYFFVTSGNLLKSLPRLTLYAIAGYRLLPALQKAFSAIAKVKHSMPSLHKLYDDLMLAKGLEDKEGESIERMPFKNKISIKNISFRYEEMNSDVLKDLNFEICKGSMTAFVGATGSGKTTLIDIITGLLSPEKGELIVDGVNTTSHNIAEWQQNIAYVPQEVYLYDDTLKANITFGKDLVDNDDKRMTSALQMAGIYDFIMNELPQGLDTKIGERGVRLSGGQRQRIGLARALYRNPTVLVLDEATSALDNITEKAIIESLKLLPDEITVIMIAHRLSTVKYADTIFLLEKGEVIGTGSYDDLIESNNTFREMDNISEKKKSSESAML